MSDSGRTRGAGAGWRQVSVAMAAAALVGAWLTADAGQTEIPLAGELPASPTHFQDDGLGRTLGELFEQGSILMSARFSLVDGQGRPASTGTGAPRVADQPAFIRTSGPDATSCADCHGQPRAGGAGGFVSNVFVLAQALDPVTESISPNFSNERNTLGMMGSGPIEILAREMSEELIAIREDALAESAAIGLPVPADLWAKDVFFGTLIAMPDGRVDPTGIEGVDWDLIVKPFHQKGAVVSLREFSNNAMNHHHGIQSTERFGTGTDPDADGVQDELTVGDITAITIFQAALNTPSQVMPDGSAQHSAVEAGEELFDEIGCTQCHRPVLMLESRLFTEPNPFNPAGNLRPEDVDEIFAFDMTREGEKPRLEKAPGGRAIVRAFTDLKRHDLSDGELTHFANEQLVQGSLVGFAAPEMFTVPPQPRPTEQFLTRKLWDVGNTAPYGHRGDLTTMTEAIWYHGGDARAQRDAFFALAEQDRAAIIAFLRTLQIVPPQSNGLGSPGGPGGNGNGGGNGSGGGNALGVSKSAGKSGAVR